MRLILASSSPRRRELLSNAGFEFEVRPSSIEEALRSGETAEEFAERTAKEKALNVAEFSAAGSWVLGADTVVVMDGEILGKPAGPEDAARMLRGLSGSTHRVITGVCLARAPDHIEALRHETTWVYFRKLSEREIQDYIASGEPMDKAGAYGIQALASKFVRRIEGCYFNVVGLPIALVCELISAASRRLDES